LATLDAVVKRKIPSARLIIIIITTTTCCLFLRTLLLYTLQSNYKVQTTELSNSNGQAQ
jgi:hypothetical protein